MSQLGLQLVQSTAVGVMNIQDENPLFLTCSQIKSLFGGIFAILQIRICSIGIFIHLISVFCV